MCKKFLEKLSLGLRLLTSPGKTFEKLKSSSTEDSIKYSLYLLLINLAISVVLNVIIQFPHWPKEEVVSTIFLLTAMSAAGLYISTIILNIAASLWLHIFAHLLGAKKGLENTVKIMFYARHPYLLNLKAD